MSTLVTDIPKPLCEHGQPLRYSGKHKAACPVCKSFWDLDAIDSEMAYDRNYPEMRSHFDPAIGSNKVKTLQRWLRKAHVELDRLSVCEIGFGGGFCLRYLSEFSRQAFGVEAIAANIEHATRLGIGRDSLFLADELPSVLPSRIDLWIFQDSFEHLPDPAGFMQWLMRNSSDSSRILLVMPDGGSMSERIFGKLWPHRISDHRFHWSRQGVIEFFAKRDFKMERSFTPQKYVSAETVIAHALLKLSPHQFRSPRKVCFPGIVFTFNIGEMGLLFARDPRHGY
jgi:hypothetical protein